MNRLSDKWNQATLAGGAYQGSPEPSDIEVLRRDVQALENQKRDIEHGRAMKVLRAELMGRRDKLRCDIEDLGEKPCV